jgi:peptidoglycan/LPS O-acetylase OafA/YrhL
LRGIAALGVMMFHFNYVFLPQIDLVPSVPGLQRAYLGCDLFFMISGFVMAHVYGDTLASNWRAHWVDFARARFARIYPLFALTTLVMVITHALVPLPMNLVSLSLSSLALQPALLQIWGPGLNWNYPGWSIGTECAAYVLFIFFAHTLVKGRYPRLLAAGCIAVLAAIILTHQGRLHFYEGWRALLRTLAEFILGALLHRAYAHNLQLPRITLAIITAGCIAAAMTSRDDLFFVLAFACLIHYATDATTWLARLMDSGPALALGAWSYSIYLWHVPTHYAVMALFAASGHPVQALSMTSARQLALVTALAVIALSALSFHYFEVPMRRAVRRWLMPSRATAPATVAG